MNLNQRVQNIFPRLSPLILEKAARHGPDSPLFIQPLVKAALILTEITRFKGGIGLGYGG
jgi:hypothetical protein